MGSWQGEMRDFNIIVEAFHPFFDGEVAGEGQSGAVGVEGIFLWDGSQEIDK